MVRNSKHDEYPLTSFFMIREGLCLNFNPRNIFGLALGGQAPESTGKVGGFPRPKVP